MLFESICYAAETAATTAQDAAAVGEVNPVAAMIVQFLPLILIFVFMYMMMIRPRKKEEKALREKINNMKVGDKVITIGGIVGKVSKIKDEFVILETGNIGTVDQKSYIKMEKSAIKTVETKIEA